MSEEITNVAIFREDLEKLHKLKRLREKVPEKKPGQRGWFSIMETCPEVLRRIIEWYIKHEGE